MLERTKKVTVIVGLPDGYDPDVVENFLEELAYTGGGVTVSYKSGKEYADGEMIDDRVIEAMVVLADGEGVAGKTACIAVSAKMLARELDQERFVLMVEDALGNVLDAQEDF